MCAIAGMIGAHPEEGALRKMLDTMQPRGPDGSGVFQDENVTLLHTRLAIIDPAGGQQPMVLDWAGERYVLTYNGELYNTQELRHRLISRGHTFRTHSDTEVVIHAYAEYGKSCTELFNGIFAFGVWEVNAKRLFLARDRIGVKPLFYANKDSRLIFASEIKTILVAGHPAAIDRGGIYQLILLGPGRLPGSGVFRDIQELKPGYRAVYEDGKLQVEQYWKLRDREHREDFSETVECVRYLVTDAIKRQMVSDVNVGAFLSGGLDSSIITAVCAEEKRKQGENLPTFSVDYENNDQFFVASKFQPNADASYIRLLADTFRTDHRRTVLAAQTLCDALEEATLARDLPGMADVDFSLLAFCKEIRPHVKVALSGECADEIFGGYPWYRDPEIRSAEGFPWAQNTRQRAQLLTAGVGAEEYVMEAYRKVCRESDILPDQDPTNKRMKEMVNLNFAYFMQTLLDRKDRMSMRCGLEVRVPFCDYRIAEYLYGVPWAFKDYEGREKGLLREAVKDLLPEQIVHRKKSPYPKTFDPGYEEMMIARLYSLMDESSPMWELIRKDRLRQLLEENAPWPWYGQLMRRPQTAAYFVQLDFWLKHYGADILI